MKPKAPLIRERSITLDEAVADFGGIEQRLARYERVGTSCLAREPEAERALVGSLAWCSVEILKRVSEARESIGNGDAAGAAMVCLDLGWLAAHADLHIKGWSGLAVQGQADHVTRTGNIRSATEARKARLPKDWRAKAHAILRQLRASDPDVSKQTAAIVISERFGGRPSWRTIQAELSKSLR